MITTPSSQVQAYLRIFDLCAVVVYIDGTIGVTKDVVRPARTPIKAAWWTTVSGAVAIKRRCEAEETSDVVTVAHKLHLPISTHAEIIDRGEMVVANINAALRQMRANGTLRRFHDEFRMRSQREAAAGRSFMTFTQAYTRLQQNLLYQAAVRGRWGADRSIIATVFGQ